MCALLGAIAAHAQENRSARDRDLFVGLDVGYSTAFRDKSWAPVTIDIVNEQRDFDGYIEVRTFDFTNEQQSPSYILPAQCPKNSSKRFALYAYLDGVERVEAWLFERGRRAVDVPAYMQVQPLGEDDLLLLVLDDDPFNYGFLYAAVQREGKVVRVSRFGLPTSDLERLPDIPQAYEAFDAILLGDIDPDRIAQRHRALIEEYVSKGGTLIVSTGKNAADYRASWVAPLLGAEIGESTLTAEGELAQLIPEALRAGQRPERQAMYASLQPAAADTRVIGDGLTLAVRRPVGEGRVYTVAIDATSHALQDTTGYQALWRDMLTAPAKANAELNFNGFSNALVQSLPNLAGVTIRPLGWVMVYLLLYLGVGVVANWLFWNALKRREMAWLCLIGFSLAFTVYAMMFGRSGNLREAQQQTVGVVHISPDGTRATVHALTGILTARTRTYSGTIDGERPVVRDAATRSTAVNVFTGMPGGGMNSRPFGWVQSEPARVESLRVGASELRMIVLEGERPADGGFAGGLEIDESGLRGELSNETGFALRNVMIAYDGLFVPATVVGDRVNVSISTSELVQRRSDETNTTAQLQYVAYAWGQPSEMVWNAVQASLFADDSFQINYDLPPYVVAWSDASPGIGFIPDARMTKTSMQTLVVSRVTVDDRREMGTDLPLLFSIGGEWFRSRGAPPVRFGQVATANVPGPLRVKLPQEVKEGDGELIVELYWGVEREEHRAILVPKLDGPAATTEDVAWHEARFEGDERVVHGNVRMRSTYRIRDWTDYVLNPDERVVEFGVTYSRVQDESTEERKFREANIQTWGEYSATARWVPLETATESTGEWPQWR
jgi:hypothetical protein